MSKLTDRANYIRGLTEGMKLEPKKDSHRLLLELVSLVKDMADELDSLGARHAELNDYVESIDDDLADLEDALFEGADGDAAPEQAHEPSVESATIDYTCPGCGEIVKLQAETLDLQEGVRCPHCGMSLLSDDGIDPDED